MFATVLRTSFGPPQLTGIRWRLDHVVKTRLLDNVHEPLFFVRILTVEVRSFLVQTR